MRMLYPSIAWALNTERKPFLDNRKPPTISSRRYLRTPFSMMMMVIIMTTFWRVSPQVCVEGECAPFWAPQSCRPAACATGIKRKPGKRALKRQRGSWSERFRVWWASSWEDEMADFSGIAVMVSDTATSGWAWFTHMNSSNWEVEIADE